MTIQEILGKINFEECDVSYEGESLSYGKLARLLFPNVTWFFDKQEGSYSGDWYMVGKDEGGRYYFFSMGYGSCSGCDWLEDALSADPKKSRKEIEKIMGSILKTPIIPNKAEALEYAKKFDWQGSYDRDESNPFVKEVITAIEAN